MRFLFSPFIKPFFVYDEGIKLSLISTLKQMTQPGPCTSGHLLEHRCDIRILRLELPRFRRCLLVVIVLSLAHLIDKVIVLQLDSRNRHGAPGRVKARVKKGAFPFCALNHIHLQLAYHVPGMLTPGRTVEILAQRFQKISASFGSLPTPARPLISAWLRLCCTLLIIGLSLNLCD